MKHALIAPLAVAGFLFSPYLAAKPSDRPPPRIELPRRGFEQIANQHGVTVYKNNTSDVVWIGAVGTIPAPVETVYGALLDYERQVGKVERVSEARVLSRGPGSLYVYQRLNLPIISDRDYILRVVHGADAARRWISFAAVTNHGPEPRAGIVRVTSNIGEWELQATEDGRGTLARCEIRIKLGGFLPLWMAKSRAGREIPRLYSDICRLSLGSAKAGTCP